MTTAFPSSSRATTRATPIPQRTAEHDYRVMQKDELDYDWDWDARCFWSRLMLLNEFDRSPGIMAPVAEVIRPCSALLLKAR